MSGFWLFLLVLFYTLTCLFVVMTVLLQSGKGGGLSSLGSGAGGALSDSLGATGAEKTLIKATAWGSGIFLALSLIITLYGAHLEKTGGLSIGNAGAASQQQTTTPASAPSQAPATAPTQGAESSKVPGAVPSNAAAPAQAPASASEKPAGTAAPAAPQPGTNPAAGQSNTNAESTQPSAPPPANPK